MRGRVLALQAIVLIGSTPVGGPFLGYVCDLVGARAGVALGGFAAVGAATWGMRAMQGQSTLPARDRSSDRVADIAPQSAGNAA
jgi:hypothetical protein